MYFFYNTTLLGIYLHIYDILYWFSIYIFRFKYQISSFKLSSLFPSLTSHLSFLYPPTSCLNGENNFQLRKYIRNANICKPWVNFMQIIMTKPNNSEIFGKEGENWIWIPFLSAQMFNDIKDINIGLLSLFKYLAENW